MPIALNGSTLGPCSLTDELHAARNAGFKLVELRAPKLSGMKDLGKVMSANRLRAWSINSLEGAGDLDLRQEAQRLAAWAASCDCPYVVCVPGRERAGLPETLDALAAICLAEGAQLAFEFMGFSWAAVRSVHDALEVYQGPLVIDTFHWMLGDGDLEVLARLDPARLAVVHVNDAPSRNLEALSDADRVLPGAGVLKLDPFYATLREIGFSGVYSVELFNPRLWERGPIAAARLAVSSMGRFEQ